MDRSLSKFWEIVKDREAGVLQFMGSQRVAHYLVTEQQQWNANIRVSSWLLKKSRMCVFRKGSLGSGNIFCLKEKRCFCPGVGSLNGERTRHNV